MKRILASVILTTFCLVNCSAQKQGIDKELSTADAYLWLLENPSSHSANIVKDLEKDWSIADAPMLLEAIRFTRNWETADLLHKFLQKKSGKKFSAGSDNWNQWLWSQQYKEHPDYAKFKSTIYAKIDPKFKDYFDNKPKTTIRLDEVRWGGVVQDGIPPLRNPKMLSVQKADYLSDNDIVFGIEVNGDARAYPKRILAWHEMFTDTIEGVPLAGVY